MKCFPSKYFFFVNNFNYIIPALLRPSKYLEKNHFLLFHLILCKMLHYFKHKKDKRLVNNSLNTRFVAELMMVVLLPFFKKWNETNFITL